MAQRQAKPEVEEMATNAIDEDETREVLRAASGEDPSDEAVRALHGTIADETADLVLRTGERARRRGRGVSGEDVGRMADRRYPSPSAQVKANPEVREAALRAIDEDETREMFRAVSEETPDDSAVTGLRETIADEITELALDASGRARRRGRSMESDDIARIAEERYKERYAPMQHFYYRD